jgi:hypothetical protein
MYKFAFFTLNKENELVINNKQSNNYFNSRTDTASLLSDDLFLFNFIKPYELDYIVDINKIDENTIIFFSSIYDFKENVVEQLSNIKAKKYIIDFASNDVIYIRNYIQSIEKYFNDKDYCIVTKSLDYKNIKNCFFYDQQLTRMSNWLFDIKKPWKDVLFNSKFNSPTITSYNFLENIKSKEKTLPSYKGLYLIGHARFHKIDLLNHLYLKNNLNDFIWTSGGRYFDCDTGYVDRDKLKEFDKFEVLNLLPKKLDYGYEESEHALISIGTFPNFSFYMDSCFEIVAETEFYKEKIIKETIIHHISEKTIKSILMSSPFLTLNFSNTLKKLENNFGLNFNTSINEYNTNYDLIENDEYRMSAIKNQCDNLLSFNKKELNDMKLEYKNQTKENLNILYEIFWRDSVKKIFDFIKY